MLLDSFQRDAEFTEFGNKVSGSSCAMPWSPGWRAALKQYPQHADIPIERPIFVTGLPRTGTTAVHRLLAADPRHQGLEMRLTEFPQPRPPREAWAENPVFPQPRGPFSETHVENPDFMGLHHMSADQVEERRQLLRQSLHSISYETPAHVPRTPNGCATSTGPAVSTASPQSAADRLKRCRDALGTEEPQPSVRARRGVGDLPRRAGDPVPPACRDDRRLDVLAGSAHHRGMVQYFRRRDDR